MNEVREARMRFLLILMVVTVITAGVVFFIVAKNNGWKFGAGEDKKTVAESGKETVAQKAEKLPPKPEFRFRKVSTSPAFGAPLDFSKSRHGDLSIKECPGSAAVATGIIVDMDSRRVLWEKNSNQPVKIASMVKMMTLLVAMEEMEKRPDVNFDTMVPVSREVLKIPRTGVVWLDPRETLPLSDLMKAAAIKSANDASTMIAIYFGGTLDNFVNRMNARAQELGLKHTRFVNACGLPDAKRGNSFSTAGEMVLLGERLLEYPQVMEWLGTQRSSIRGGKTDLITTNKLVNPRWPGVDGMKTGFFSKAGFCLTFSVLRDGRRVIGCVTGCRVAKDRDRFCRKLIDWAYAQPQK